MVEETSAERRADLARKISGLLEKAAATPFGPEADAFRAKADELATVYAIESWELDRAKPKAEREMVSSRKFTIATQDHPQYDALCDLVWVIANHARCKMVYHGLRSKLMKDMGLATDATVVGFPSDLDYVQTLWVSLQLQMAAELKPGIDQSQTEEQNLVRLKEAGMKWQDIHRVLHPDVPWERRHGVRYTKVYTDHCKKNGKDRMYTSPQVYVRSFAEGFVAKISLRLAAIRDAQKAEGGVASGGAELALIDRSKEVGDTYSEMFPSLKMAPNAAQKKTDWGANSAGVRAGEKADLGQGKLRTRKEIG